MLLEPQVSSWSWFGSCGEDSIWGTDVFLEVGRAKERAALGFASQIAIGSNCPSIVLGPGSIGWVSAKVPYPRDQCELAMPNEAHVAGPTRGTFHFKSAQRTFERGGPRVIALLGVLLLSLSVTRNPLMAVTEVSLSTAYCFLSQLPLLEQCFPH